MTFDAVLRGFLREKGYDVKADPAQWKVPKEVLEEGSKLAVDEALRISFSAEPKWKLTKSLVRLWRENPIMFLAQPFPRFFFGNALARVWEYSPAQLLNPASWKAARNGDFRPMIKGMEGTMMLTWATSYRMQDDAPGRWYMVKVGGKDVLLGPLEEDELPEEN